MNYNKDRDSLITIFINKYLDPLLYNVGLNMPNIIFLVGCFYIYMRGGCVQKFILLFVINIIINQILKHYYKHPRPIKAVIDGSIPGDSYGMPSGHAQVVTFAFVYLMIQYPDNRLLPILSTMFIPVTIMQRIYSNKHTPIQTFAGIFAGILSAFILTNIDVSFIE